MSIFILSLVIVISISLYNQDQKNKKVEMLKVTAIEMIDKEEYQKAVDVLSEAIEIKSSEELVKLHKITKEAVANMEIVEKSKKAYINASDAVDNKEYKIALNYYKKVSTIDYENYDNAQIMISSINDYLSQVCLNEAKQLYNKKEYINAYSSLKKSLDYSPNSEEANSLIDSYMQKKETQIAEREEEILKEQMESYESGYGPISIAATARVSGISNDCYVWLYVNARNNGTDVSHVNPNYFTLSSPNGYTTNVDSNTYSRSDYFDAIDLRPNTYSSGWMLFRIDIADYYILNYDSLDSFVEKKIVY